MQEFYDEIIQSYARYKETYGTVADSIYMNASKYAEFYSWSSKTGENLIEITQSARSLFGMRIYTHTSFEFDFFILEENDVKNAIQNSNETINKFKPMDLSKNEDSLTPYNTMETIQLKIPESILNFRMGT
ncbi:MULTISPECIES: hypothetical protein [Acinetobacter]|uniref:hypothetical protein n=1 Tax=Acinetobacter TaxID=469 RepID=UPI00029CA726|nr:MULTISPECIES: hypothetical protein [Acinetobacter]EKU38125.1 hypothetical protein ACINWC141_1102 [Acinetobacter sp. WC-141]MBM7141194.1 hypothetical protein [Acinetobacter sp. 105-3]